jgi:hypothetical protein
LEKRLRLSREIRSLFAFRLPFRIYPPAAALFQGGIRHYTGVFAALRRCNFTPLPGGFLQRSTFAALLLGLTSVTSAQEPPTAIPVQTIELQPLAAARPLPDRILGANVNLFYEKMAEDPAKVAILKTMDIGTVRFPGGTDGQFWQPQTGTFEVPLDSNASFYRKFWAAIAPRLNALHPNGIQVDEAKRFLDQIGAAMVLVPNLDTSTLQVQTSWYQKLAAQHLIPSRIEMGNEAYLAMIGDPASLKRFPDEAHYLAIAKQNLDALQPYLPPGAKIAVQAAPAGFTKERLAGRAMEDRFEKWNHDLTPQPWFQAVTVHLYAREQTVVGNGGGMDGMRLFAAYMGRFDSGVDHMIQRIAARVPGKEIWCTEWNPRGGDPSALTRSDPRTPAMMMHASTRTIFAFLRHPEVTQSSYFMLDFDLKQAFTVFVKQAGGYQTVPVTEALTWLDQAANGGATFREYAWGQKIPSGGVIPGETYDPVVAGLFEHPQTTTLIIQNATPTAFKTDLQTFQPAMPKRIEVMTPPMDRQDLYPAEVLSVAPARLLTLPPFSLIRVTWEK